MQFQIYGDDFQILFVELENGEEILAEAGSMVYMSGNVKMEAVSAGGFTTMIKRVLTGESLFLTSFRPVNSVGFVAFSLPFPGKIVPVDVTGREIILQRDAFIAMQPTVRFDLELQKKLGAIFFGGEGLILEKFYGSGYLFFGGLGQIVELTLQPGQTIKVSTGKVVGWEGTVTYDIQRVGGLKTMLFGGEGIFVTTLTGPGKVWLQSTSLQELKSMVFTGTSEGGRGGFFGIGGRESEFFRIFR